MVKQRIIVSALSLLMLCSFCTIAAADDERPGEKHGRVTVDVDLKAAGEAKEVRLWIPYPLSDENQDISNVAVSGNYSAMSVLRDGHSGNVMLFTEWREPVDSRRLTYSFDVTRKERITHDFKGKELPFARREYEQSLAMDLEPATAAKVKTLASSITKGKKSTLAKAETIYNWVVDNMHRDPEVKGCGLADISRLLVTKKGKCADISSVFVALARAAGIPARDILGIRLPKDGNGDMTKSQHCWAEFYRPGHGWIVVDPADVTKARLVQKLDKVQLEPFRKYYFGTVDENRIALGKGRNIRLNPPQQGDSLNYFMYPYAEADGKALNEDLFGFNIGYRISFTESRSEAQSEH